LFDRLARARADVERGVFVSLRCLNARLFELPIERALQLVVVARDGHARSRSSASAKARPYCYHMAMARTQTLVQLSDELLERLDARRAREGRSRSEVVREAIEQYLAADREAEIDRLIVEAYTRRPPEDVWGDEPAKRMIAAEPW
jgi:predicted DNA-binding protein